MRDVRVAGRTAAVALVLITLISVPCSAASENATTAQLPPNFVIVFADDLGYGDLSCYGHPTLRTPQLDRMAMEGMRFTQFYSAASVCTPSRAALMTGRLPVRNGMCSDSRRVLFPNSGGGIPADEVTLAEALQNNGYATACVGKWHLGHLSRFLPTRHGFDEYFGIPYSNDMDRVADRDLGRSVFLDPKSEYWDVPLLRNEQIIERPADQTTLTRRYTQEAVRFITAQRDRPFFLYFPHTMPHVPLFRSPEFVGHSARGLYGDVVEEIDWSVGEVLGTLRQLGLDRRTFVFFTSDNGPWLSYHQQGGSAGLLRDGKGSTWEGGMREPALAWCPGTIPSGSISSELVTTMDLFPTVLNLAGVDVPADRLIDGVDVRPVLLAEGKSPRETVYYYRGTRLMAVRHREWKAHFETRPSYGREPAKKHDPPLLFQLEHDPSERDDVSKDHPEIIAEINEVVRRHQSELTAPASQLEIHLEGE